MLYIKNKKRKQKKCFDILEEKKFQVVENL